MKQIAPGIAIGDGWQQIVHHHPTVEEVELAGQQIEEIRSLLSRCRGKLLYLRNVVPGLREQLECVQQALTPLIAYLYEPMQQLQAWPTKRQAFLQTAQADPEHYRMEEHPIPRPGDGKCQGCVDAYFAFGAPPL